MVYEGQKKRDGSKGKIIMKNWHVSKKKFQDSSRTVEPKSE
jgi:hypothetical protein